MNSIAHSSHAPWRAMAAEFSAALSFFSTDPDDLVDASTKPATNLTDGRFVIDCDGGGLVQLKLAGGDGTENDTFKFRVYTWSLIVPASGDPTYSAEFIAEVTATVGTMLAGPLGLIGSQGGMVWADTLVIDNMANSRSVRVLGRDNGAGDGTNTADQCPQILEFDRRADQLVEIQTCVIDGARPLPLIRFCSAL